MPIIITLAILRRQQYFFDTACFVSFKKMCNKTV